MRIPRTSIPLASSFASNALAAYLAVFVLLSLDVVIRVFLMRHRLESMTTAAVLIALELARAFTTTLVIIVALRIGRRGLPAARDFSLLLLLLGLWYTKAFAGSFAGYGQEWMAYRLLDMGVPASVMRFVFGEPVWAMWLAIAAALILSTRFPRPLDARTIRDSAGRDRTGLLRTVRYAGLDVGDALRRLAARALETGWLRAERVWIIAAAAGTLHALLPSLAVQAPLSALACMGFAITITNARASHFAARPRHGRRLLWAVQAGVAALGAFLISALLSLRPDAATAALSFAVVAVGPILVLITLTSEVGARRTTDPLPALRRTLLIAAGGITGTAAWLLVGLTLSRMPAGDAAVREIIAVAASIVIVGAFRRPLGLVATRLLAGGHAAAR